MQTRLKVPPGRYQVRFAARETGSGHIGSVTYDMEVPDFAKEPLSMSGVLLAAASRQQVITAKPDEELKNVLPAAPDRDAGVPGWRHAGHVRGDLRQRREDAAQGEHHDEGRGG